MPLNWSRELVPHFPIKLSLKQSSVCNLPKTKGSTQQWIERPTKYISTTWAKVFQNIVTFNIWHHNLVNLWWPFEQKERNKNFILRRHYLWVIIICWYVITMSYCPEVYCLWLFEAFCIKTRLFYVCYICVPPHSGHVLKSWLTSFIFSRSVGRGGLNRSTQWHETKSAFVQPRVST